LRGSAKRKDKGRENSLDEKNGHALTRKSYYFGAKKKIGRQTGGRNNGIEVLKGGILRGGKGVASGASQSRKRSPRKGEQRKANLVRSDIFWGGNSGGPSRCLPRKKRVHNGGRRGRDDQIHVDRRDLKALRFQRGEVQSPTGGGGRKSSVKERKRKKEVYAKGHFCRPEARGGVLGQQDSLRTGREAQLPLEEKGFSRRVRSGLGDRGLARGERTLRSHKGKKKTYLTTPTRKEKRRTPRSEKKRKGKSTGREKERGETRKKKDLQETLYDLGKKKVG